MIVLQLVHFLLQKQIPLLLLVIKLKLKRLIPWRLDVILRLLKMAVSHLALNQKQQLQVVKLEQNKLSQLIHPQLQVPLLQRLQIMAPLMAMQ